MLRSMLAGFLCAFTMPVLSSSAEEKPNWIGNDTFVVARIGDSNSYAAYSKYSGKWAAHSFPANVVVAPVVLESLIAFRIDGEAVTQIVAVGQSGEWKVQTLPHATAQPCIPVANENVVTYRIGDRTYGFSGKTGTWDSTTQSGVVGQGVSVSGDTAMIVASDRISIFSAQTGTWAESPILTESE